MSAPTDLFDPDALLARACEVTGLTDFGDEDFREPFAIATASLDREAGLSPSGRTLMSAQVSTYLTQRLGTFEWVRRHPEIAEEPLTAPIVVAGLPRTGTTMLYRMLSVADGLTAPLNYEVTSPAPPFDWDFQADSDPRPAAAEIAIAAMNAGAPELVSIYPFEARAPEEDIFLIKNSFRSTGLHAYARMPSYEDWFATADKGPAYDYLAVSLRLLQWQRRNTVPPVPPARWLLKTPDHLHSFGELIEAFPDAKVIQTHRDPVQTIPSICSFIRALHSLCRDDPDSLGIGRAWSEMFAASMTKALAVREKYPDHFLDIWYEDTVARPREVAEAVFDFVGMELTDAVWAEMERWRDANQREARPAHRYTLEEFGLSTPGIERLFADYRERFILPRTTTGSA
jgi:hypothetical protein